MSALLYSAVYPSMFSPHSGVTYQIAAPPQTQRGTKRKTVFTQMKTFSLSTEVLSPGRTQWQLKQSQNSTSLNAHIRHQLPGDHVCGNIFLPFSLLLLLFSARAESSVFTDELSCRAGGQTEHAFTFQAKTSLLQRSRDGHVSLYSACLALTHHNSFQLTFREDVLQSSCVAHLQVRPTLVPPSTEQKSQVTSGRRTKQLIK